MINEIKTNKREFTTNSFINVNVDVGAVVSFTPVEPPAAIGFGYVIIPVTTGQYVDVVCTGSRGQARSWAWLDTDKKLLSVAGTVGTGTEATSIPVNGTLVAKQDGYLVINNKYSLCANPSCIANVNKIQHKDGEVRKVYCNEVLDEWVKDKYINTSGDVGSVVDIEHPSASLSKYGYQLINCQIGDKFTMTCNGGTAPRAWCFVDKDDKIVSSSNSSVTCRDTEVVAPCDGKLIVHNKMDDQPNPSVKKLSKIWYPHGLVDIGANQSFSFSANYITTNLDVGAVVEFAEYTANYYKHTIINVKKDDSFTITLKGGAGPRAWAFLDNQRKLVSKADNNAVCDGLTLTAPCDGYLVLNSVNEYTQSPSAVRTNAHTYPTVKIGTREWLGANLDETLGKIQSDEFYYNNDKFTYGKYGKLYKWDTLCSASETHSATLAGILPTGWRLAKKADFDNLVALDSTGSLFRDENFSSGGNNSNMSMLAGGLRNNSEAFDLIGQSGYCWSSSKLSTFATRLIVNNNAISINDSGSSLVGAYSVRLVRDHLPTPTYTLPRTTFTGQASDIVNTHKKIMLATGDSEGVDNWTLFINVESNTSSSAGRMWDVAFNATQTGGIDGSCLSSGTTGNAFATYKKTSWDTIFTTPRKIAIRRSTSKDYIQYSLDGVIWIDTWIEVSKIAATASAIPRRALCFGGRADLGSSAGTGTMSATLWDTALDDVSSMFV